MKNFINTIQSGLSLSGFREVFSQFFPFIEDEFCMQDNFSGEEACCCCECCCCE